MFMCIPQNTYQAWVKFSLQSLLGVILTLTGLTAVTPTYANSVVSIIDHGNIDAEPYSGSGTILYGVYRKALYYTSRGNIYRLNYLGGVPEKLPLPDGVTQAYASKFIVFDDALFVLLNGRLYRFEARARQWQQVDVPQTIFNFPWEVQVPRIYELVVHNEQLFLLASEMLLGCQYQGGQDYSLYRLQAADAVVDKVWLPREIGCTSLMRLKSTGDGLIYVESIPGNRYGTNEPRNNINRIVTPLSNSNPPAEDISYLLTDSYDSRDRSIAWTPGKLFFRGRQAEPSSPDAPAVGPFPHPGNPHAPYYHESNEPYRFDFATEQTVYFDLNQTFDQTAESPSDRIIGSSDPGHFVAANKSVYFRASAEDAAVELYRISPTTALPELISLNPNAPSMAAPLGQFYNRLWVRADSGAGIDLHFFENDGVTAVPLGVTESVAVTARGFTEFDGKVIFSAVDSDNILKTWVAKIDRRNVIDTTSLKTSIFIGGRALSDQVRVVKKRNSRLNIRCNVSNHSGTDVAWMRTTLVQQDQVRDRYRPRLLKACRNSGLADGQAINCSANTRIRSAKRVRFICKTRAETTSGKKLYGRETVVVVVRR